MREGVVRRGIAGSGEAGKSRTQGSSGDSMLFCCYIQGMKRILVLISILVGAMMSACPALAHRPYFTEVEKIRLPNGEMGEARLLNGDGIFGPDPVRVIVLDAQGRLLARSQKSLSMAISCREEGHCLIFDLTNDKVLDLDISTFRRGDPVPGLADEQRNELWGLEDGEETWGFTPRDPYPGERLAGFKALFSQHLPILVFDGLIGALCSLFGIGLQIILKARRTRRLEALARMIAVLAIAAAGLFLILLSGLVSFIDGMPFMVWLSALALGPGMVIASYALMKQARSRSAAGQGLTP